MARGPLDPVEVACDESGSEGQNLVGGETDVFAHASVVVSAEQAAACVRQTHERIRSPVTEYKAGHFLRAKHRKALEWLLAEDGPIHGHARVHLIDKTFFAVGRVVDLITGAADPRAGEMAGILYRDGRAAFGPERWREFLRAFTVLMRGGSRRGEQMSAADFLKLVDELCGTGAPGEAREIMALLSQARARVESVRPGLVPSLDPLLPAIVRAVEHWSAGGRPVVIVHHRQAALTGDRLAWLTETAGGRLAGLRLVDSRDDPRVQVADYLAGVARKIASNELNARGDAELTELLRPYVDPLSVWGDGALHWAYPVDLGRWDS